MSCSPVIRRWLGAPFIEGERTADPQATAHSQTHIRIPEYQQVHLLTRTLSAHLIRVEERDASRSSTPCMTLQFSVGLFTVPDSNCQSWEPSVARKAVSFELVKEKQSLALPTVPAYTVPPSTSRPTCWREWCQSSDPLPTCQASRACCESA